MSQALACLIQPQTGTCVLEATQCRRKPAFRPLFWCSFSGGEVLHRSDPAHPAPSLPLQRHPLCEEVVVGGTGATATVSFAANSSSGTMRGTSAQSWAARTSPSQPHNLIVQLPIQASQAPSAISPRASTVLVQLDAGGHSTTGTGNASCVGTSEALPMSDHQHHASTHSSEALPGHRPPPITHTQSNRSTTIPSSGCVSAIHEINALELLGPIEDALADASLAGGGSAHPAGASAGVGTGGAVTGGAAGHTHAAGPSTMNTIPSGAAAALASDSGFNLMPPLPRVLFRGPRLKVGIDVGRVHAGEGVGCFLGVRVGEPWAWGLGSCGVLSASARGPYAPNSPAPPTRCLLCRHISCHRPHDVQGQGAQPLSTVSGCKSRSKIVHACNCAPPGMLGQGMTTPWDVPNWPAGLLRRRARARCGAARRSGSGHRGVTRPGCPCMASVPPHLGHTSSREWPPPWS